MADKPEDKQLDIQESLKTSEKTSGESTIGSTSRQNDWGRVNEISHQNDQHPSEVEGVKAIDSFGIDFGDGSVMTAKGLEGKSPLEHQEISYGESLPPPVSRERMMEIAEREKSHPTKWKSIQGKCNQYLDKVAGEAGMRLPWKVGSPPTSGGPGGMHEKLEKNSDFEEVWKTDYTTQDRSLGKFMHFRMEPGDLVIWDVPKSGNEPPISHSAIATGPRKIIYAGSKAPKGNGCGHCDIKYYSGEPKKPLNYGPPTAIYRYKNMTK